MFNNIWCSVFGREHETTTYKPQPKIKTKLDEYNESTNKITEIKNLMVYVNEENEYNKLTEELDDLEKITPDMEELLRDYPEVFI